MNPLKKLFTIKPKVIGIDGTKKADHIDKDIDTIKLTYYQCGYGDAKGALGEPKTLKVSLSNVFESFKEDCRKNEEEQEKLRHPVKVEQGKIQTEIVKRRTVKEIKTEQIKNLESEIKQIETDIQDVRIQPDRFGIDADKRPKAQFYIGLLLLLPITIYLIVFYISASYSAFFKTFANTNLQAAIFDAKAIDKAFDDGILEAVFVCTIPFAFMGLGYLIHMFNKEKKTGLYKILLLFIVTFLFDGILAYLIEQKIYNFEKTIDSENFNLAIAVSKIEFWGIIFAGFVTYIIWGLVLDFVMKEWENMDKIKMFIRVQNLNKSKLLDDRKRNQELINQIEEEISQLTGRVKELQGIIDGFIFPSKKYRLFHSEYVKGWFMAINKEIALPHKEKEYLLTQCEQVSEVHLKDKEVYDENSELTVFASAG